MTKDIGYVVAMGGDKNVQKVLENADDLNIITYGMESKFDYYPENIVYHAGFPSFDVMKNGEKVCHIKLNVPGEHNILNSLATVAVCNLMGVDAETAAKGIETFKGTHRRFEKKGFLNGAVVIDDYAHHPTEIKATLHAAQKFPHNRAGINISYSSVFSSSILIESSSSCLASTTSGALVRRQDASFTLGKAITSLIESLLAISITSLSRPCLLYTSPSPRDS